MNVMKLESLYIVMGFKLYEIHISKQWKFKIKIVPKKDTKSGQFLDYRNNDEVEKANILILFKYD